MFQHLGNKQERTKSSAHIHQFRTGLREPTRILPWIYAFGDGVITDLIKLGRSLKRSGSVVKSTKAHLAPLSRVSTKKATTLQVPAWLTRKGRFGGWKIKKRSQTLYCKFTWARNVLFSFCSKTILSSGFLVIFIYTRSEEI